MQFAQKDLNIKLKLNSKTVKVLNSTIFLNSRISISLVEVSCWTCPIRSMKSFVKSLYDLDKERLANQMEGIIGHLFNERLKSKNDLLLRTASYFANETLGEKICQQSITKGLIPRLSATKSSLSSALKDSGFTVTNKIDILNSNEKSDVRFFSELITASEFSKTSNHITKITMNSENSKVAILHPTSTNKFPDIILHVNNMSLIRDIKSGHNMYNIDKGFIGEIPYNVENNLYSILNKPKSLKTIQLERFNIYEDIRIPIKQINNDNKLDELEKNILIQEEIFKLIAINSRINPSFYYGLTIQDFISVNIKFRQRLTPYITEQIFTNKKEFQLFAIKAIKIYNEEIKEIASNIQNSKEFWMGTGFEQIADDLF
jgi:hypothetical protein